MPTRPNIVTSNANRHERLRRARTVQGFGGLALFASCFLPAVDACGTPFVPAQEIWEEAARSPSRDWLWITMIGLPYIVGFAAFVAWRRRRRALTQQVQPPREPVFWLLSLAVILAAGAFLTYPNWEAGARLGPPWAISVLCLARTIRRGPDGCLSVRFVSPLWCVYWFGGFFVDGLFDGPTTMYGLWLSLAGSLACVYGVFREAVVLSYSPGWPVLARLLTGSVVTHDLGEPRCDCCGYLLRGLPSPRCPECDTVFESKDQDPTRSNE